MAKEITFERIITFLLETPLFLELDETELSEILGIMQIRRIREGQALVREGDQGDGWYVVFDGEAVVTKQQDTGVEREVAVLRPRTCFGEMAILDGSPRSASVSARGDLTVLRFPRDAFEQLLREDNLAAYKLVLEMARVLCERQRNLTRQFSELLARREISGSHVRQRIGPIIDNQVVSE